MTQEQNTAEGRGRQQEAKRRTAIISVASAVLVVAVALGIGFGVRAHNKQVAREQAVAAARTSCKSSLLRLTKAKSTFDKTLKDDSTRTAVRLTADQVKDGKTLDAVKRESKDSTTLSGCESGDAAALTKAARANDRAADSLSAQNGRLTSAVKQANESKAQKDYETVQAAQKAKEAQEAAAAAQAQAAQQAAQAQAAQQAQQQAQQQARQAAPRYSYTTPRYSAPRYTAPVQPSRPAAPAQPQQSAPPLPNGGNLGNGGTGPSRPPHINWG